MWDFFFPIQSFYWFIICRYVITLGVPPWQAQILYTKYKILSKKKFNVSTDNRYSLCKDDVETSLHVFIKCLEILSLWINSACISTVKLQIEFDLIFGKIPLNEGNTVDNFIFLYTKQYIFNRLKKRRSLTWRGYYNTFNFNKWFN